jgi:excisionase family DNA binding protein
MTDTSMTLIDACKMYFHHNPRITNPRTVEHYAYTINVFGEMLGRLATIADLTDDNVLALMRHVTDQGRAAATANSYRKCVVALWAWLAKRRYVDYWPAVPKLPEPKRVPRAWSQEELARLIQACRETPGTIGAVPSPHWWLAFHGVAWDTGARTGELLSLEWAWLDTSRGILTVPAEKRKGKTKDAAYQLMEDTLKCLERIRTPHPLIFFGLGHKSSFWQRYGRLLKRAGLPNNRYTKPQKLRRSHASWLKLAGGDATASLGHSTDAVTRQSYLDPTISNEAPASQLFRILDTSVEDENRDDPTEAEQRRRQMLAETLVEMTAGKKPKPIEHSGEVIAPESTDADPGAEAEPPVTTSFPTPCDDGREFEDRPLRDPSHTAPMPTTKPYKPRRPPPKFTTFQQDQEPEAKASSQAELHPDRLLTRAEACARLQISDDTLRRLVQAGKVPVIKIGSRVRFTAETIDRLQTQGTENE